MLAAANALGTTGRYREGNRKRARAMIFLLRFTGMRISDASTLAKKSFSAGRPVHMDRLSALLIPCDRHQRAQAGGVIVVMMGDEDRSDFLDADAGLCQTACDHVAGIDDI